MTNLYNWVFHFNEYTNLWAAIPRDLYNDYWSNKDVKGILKSSNMETLTAIICKIEEDPKFLESL